MVTSQRLMDNSAYTLYQLLVQRPHKW